MQTAVASAEIYDASAPSIVATGIPTLSQWCTILLSGLVTLFGLRLLGSPVTQRDHGLDRLGGLS